MISKICVCVLIIFYKCFFSFLNPLKRICLHCNMFDSNYFRIRLTSLYFNILLWLTFFTACLRWQETRFDRIRLGESAWKQVDIYRTILTNSSLFHFILIYCVNPIQWIICLVSTIICFVFTILLWKSTWKTAKHNCMCYLHMHYSVLTHCH